MLAQLRALGVRVGPKVTEEFNGKFAWVIDPEGNKIELWSAMNPYRCNDAAMWIDLKPEQRRP